MATHSPPPPPRSVADSGNNSPNNKVDAATDNGAGLVDDKKPNFIDGLDHLDSPQCIERFRKYDAEYTHRMMAKYFSNKSLFGANLYDVQVTLQDEIVRSASAACYNSYQDLIVGFEEQPSNGSSPPADSQPNLPNGKHAVKKEEPK